MKTKRETGGCGRARSGRGRLEYFILHQGHTNHVDKVEETHTNLGSLCEFDSRSWPPSSRSPLADSTSEGGDSRAAGTGFNFGICCFPSFSTGQCSRCHRGGMFSRVLTALLLKWLDRCSTPLDQQDHAPQCQGGGEDPQPAVTRSGPFFYYYWSVEDVRNVFYIYVMCSCCTEKPRVDFFACMSANN